MFRIMRVCDDSPSELYDEDYSSAGAAYAFLDVAGETSDDYFVAEYTFTRVPRPLPAYAQAFVDALNGLEAAGQEISKYEGSPLSCREFEFHHDGNHWTGRRG